MQIDNNKVVSITYVLTDDDGEVLETAEAGDELIYLHGHGFLPEGLENALMGKKAGERFQIDVPAEMGFGEYDENLVEAVPRAEFQGVDDIQVGMQFESETDEGYMIVTVVEVNDESVTVDGNHELAGLDLHYDVQVVDVRDATEEELEHGHAHGQGCDDDDEDWDDDDLNFDDDDEEDGEEQSEDKSSPRADLN